MLNNMNGTTKIALFSLIGAAILSFFMFTETASDDNETTAAEELIEAALTPTTVDALTETVEASSEEVATEGNTVTAEMVITDSESEDTVDSSTH